MGDREKELQALVASALRVKHPENIPADALEHPVMKMVADLNTLCPTYLWGEAAFWLYEYTRSQVAPGWEPQAWDIGVWGEDHEMLRAMSRMEKISDPSYGFVYPPGFLEIFKLRDSSTIIHMCRCIDPLEMMVGSLCSWHNLIYRDRRFTSAPVFDVSVVKNCGFFHSSDESLVQVTQEIVQQYGDRGIQFDPIPYKTSFAANPSPINTKSSMDHLTRFLEARENRVFRGDQP